MIAMHLQVEGANEDFSENPVGFVVYCFDNTAFCLDAEYYLWNFLARNLFK